MMGLCPIPGMRAFYGVPPHTRHEDFLWGSTPYPARFFRKSGGKTIFLPQSRAAKSAATNNAVFIKITPDSHYS